VGVILFSACGGLSVLQPTPIPTLIAPAVINELERAKSVVVRDTQEGEIYRKFSCSLQRTPTQFEGNTNLSIFISGEGNKNIRESIMVSLDTMSSVLKKLKQAPLENGEYKPELCIDGMHRLYVDIELENSHIQYHSDFCSVDKIMWEVVGGGERYVTHSSEPLDALSILCPYLLPEYVEYSIFCSIKP